MMRSGFLSVQPTDEFGTHGAQTASSSELNPSPNPHIENNNNNTNHNPPTPQSHISNGVGGVVGGGGMVLHNSGVHNGAASAVESSAMGMYDNDLLQHLTDDDEKHHVIIGHIKTQWNEDFTLMQLLLYLFEMHTFGEASEVPEEVWEGVARAVFEVENVILNPLLTRWSSTEGIEALRQLVTRWREFGPGEQVYDTSRELLEKVVEPDIAGTVKPTIIRSLWKSLGASSRLPFLMWFYLVTTILAAAVCAAQAIIAARNEGGTSLAQIVCAVCSGIVFLIAASVPIVGLTVAHHNAVMHGIVNFMEMRRFRDVLPASSSDTPDMGGSVLSAEDYIEHEHHLPSPNHHHNNTSSHATDHFGPAAFSFAGASTTKMNNNQNALPTQHNNIGGGPHSSVRTIGLSSSKRFLPRFEQFGGGSAIGNNLALVSHGLSFTNNNNANGAVGAHSASTNAAINNNNGGAGGGGEGTFNTEREAPKAHILCVDNALVTSLCFPLWKCRVSVVCYTDIKEFASAALRVRHDRLRLLFIHESLVTESTYQMFKPLEDACPQQVTYFAQEETSSSETSGGNRSSVIPKNLIVYNISESDILRIVTLAQEQSMNVNATQDIMKHGKHFTIPQYTLGRRLGGGAFGNVFEAEMDALGGRCAVKRIYFKTGEATERLREIGREVDIMSRLQHPNIVQYLFCRREGNCVCIFMELCEGGSLSGQIQRRELTADLIKYFLRQIIEAVMYLHDKFIIHRDLKPENVLFRNGQVKLTDFGTAAKFQGADGQQRNIKGTFPFMAPEVLLEEPYGKQCDVWSIGCIAADMLGVVLDHRSLGLIELTRFFHDLSLMMAIEAESEEPNVKDFLERCFCRDPLRRPTPALLLQHTILRPEDGSIRRHLEQVPSRLGRRPSGAQSLRSQNIPGGANQTDNESEF